MPTEYTYYADEYSGDTVNWTNANLSFDGDILTAGGGTGLAPGSVIMDITHNTAEDDVTNDFTSRNTKVEMRVYGWASPGINTVYVGAVGDEGGGWLTSEEDIRSSIATSSESKGWSDWVLLSNGVQGPPPSDWEDPIATAWTWDVIKAMKGIIHFDNVEGGQAFEVGSIEYRITSVPAWEVLPSVMMDLDSVAFNDTADSYLVGGTPYNNENLDISFGSNDLGEIDIDLTTISQSARAVIIKDIQFLNTDEIWESHGLESEWTGSSFAWKDSLFGVSAWTGWYTASTTGTLSVQGSWAVGLRPTKVRIKYVLSNVE